MKFEYEDIGSIFEDFRQSREYFYYEAIEEWLGSQDEDVKSMTHSIWETAHALIHGASNLASPDLQKDALSQIYQLAKKLKQVDDTSIWDVISPRLTLYVAEDACMHIMSANEKILTLFGCVADIELSPRAVKFLQHVSRCYIYDFKAECVILCRAVLDAEFEYEISNDDCIDILGSRNSRYFNLDDRIAVAVKKGWLQYETGELARKIKKTGNAAVHEDPNYDEDPLDMIKSTLKVLSELKSDFVE